MLNNNLPPDDRPTPAYKINDGVDFVPLSLRKNQMIELLGIAGMGPVLGTMQGILFGPIAFLLIPLGCIFMGGVHDYFAGMISIRNKGMQVTGLIHRYLGKHWFYFFFSIISAMMLLATVVYVYTSGDLIATKFFNVTDFSLNNPMIIKIYAIIIAYYLCSFIVVIAIVVLPITTGDSALRGFRLTLADSLKIKQTDARKRFILSILVILGVILVLIGIKFYSNFNFIWRYCMFVDGLIVLPTFFYATIYLYKNNKNYFITLIPGLLFVYIDCLFILNNKIGFNLNYVLSNILAISIAVFAFFYIKEKCNKKYKYRMR